jgi:hypothetical protein
LGRDRPAEENVAVRIAIKPLTSNCTLLMCCSGVHGFSKPVHDSLGLLAGLGVDGDAHLGVTAKHRGNRL